MIDKGYLKIEKDPTIYKKKALASLLIAISQLIVGVVCFAIAASVKITAFFATFMIISAISLFWSIFSFFSIYFYIKRYKGWTVVERKTVNDKKLKKTYWNLFIKEKGEEIDYLNFCLDNLRTNVWLLLNHEDIYHTYLCSNPDKMIKVTLDENNKVISKEEITDKVLINTEILNKEMTNNTNYYFYKNNNLMFKKEGYSEAIKEAIDLDIQEYKYYSYDNSITREYSFCENKRKGYPYLVKTEESFKISGIKIDIDEEFNWLVGDIACTITIPELHKRYDFDKSYFLYGITRYELDENNEILNDGKHTILRAYDDQLLINEELNEVNEKLGLSDVALDKIIEFFDKKGYKSITGIKEENKYS